MSWLVLALLAQTAPAPAAAAPSGDGVVPNTEANKNLLATATARPIRGIEKPNVLTDGQLTFEGDEWNTDWTSKVATDGIMEWDLGSTKPIGAGFIQGDNNDTYILLGSDDGTTWFSLWRTDIDALAGIRSRQNLAINKQARYVRLSAEGGDKLYSVAELILVSDPANLKVDWLPRRPKPPRPEARFDAGWLVTLGVAAWFVWYFNERLRERRRARTEPAGKDDAAPAVKS